MSTKVCSNDFVRGYRTSECPTPTLYNREYDCGSTKTFKTCSKDEIYRELVYEENTFVFVKVKVELDKVAQILIHCRWYFDRRKGLYTCNSWGISDMNSQCYLNLSKQKLLCGVPHI